jgi:ribosomal protein L30/L7E
MDEFRFAQFQVFVREAVRLTVKAMLKIPAFRNPVYLKETRSVDELLKTLKKLVKYCNQGRSKS